MSKELTEQWRNGTIDWGLYYVKVVGRNDITIADTNLDEELNVDEVLAPVPDYDEWKTAYECQLMESEEVLTLKEQLSEANAIIKSLKDARSQSVNEYLEKYGVENE